ncbi:MAG TPA: hypothetical protein VKY65_12945 [Alphaproteobacteria bacterium]|nr:hypothetical protein [Alphaproteobacteria bacterium]
MKPPPVERLVEQQAAKEAPARLAALMTAARTRGPDFATATLP